MQFSKHFYAITGLVVLLTAISVGSNRVQTKSSATSVLVTNSTIPVTLSASSAALKIGNSKSDPIPVRDVDVANRTHVHGSENSGFEDGSDFTSFFLYTAPLGKKLIVQGISLRALLPAGQNLWGVAVHTGSERYFVKVERQGKAFDGRDVFVAQMDAPIESTYPGTIEVFISRDQKAGEALVSADLTGYLVNEPTPAP